MKRASVFVMSCIFVCLLSASAMASGFALNEWGNRSVAMGTSNYAVGNDASVVAYNPALMTQFEHTQVLVGLNTVLPSVDVNITDGPAGSTGEYSLKDETYLLPHAYVVHPYSEDIAFGMGIFTRFGLGTSYNEDWGGKTMLQEIMLEAITFQPTAAFQVTDKLSFAAGPEIIKGSMKLKKALPLALGSGTATIDVDGVSIGGIAALHYQFDDNWSMGFSYRSPIKFTGRGDVEVSNTIGPFKSGDATVSATFPASYGLGLGYEEERNWAVEASVLFTQWEDFDYMHFDYGASTLLPSKEEAFYYKNTWRFQLGGEYFVVEDIALRAGYVFDQTPIRHDYASVMLPSNDRHLFSLGLGIYGEKWNCDLTGMYIFAKDRQGISNSVDGGNDYQYDFKNGKTWVFGISGGYAF